MQTTESHSLGEKCLVANQDKQIATLSFNVYVQQLGSLSYCNFLCFQVLVTVRLVHWSLRAATSWCEPDFLCVDLWALGSGEFGSRHCELRIGNCASRTMFRLPSGLNRCKSKRKRWVEDFDLGERACLESFMEPNWTFLRAFWNTRGRFLSVVETSGSALVAFPVIFVKFQVCRLILGWLFAKLDLLESFLERLGTFFWVSWRHLEGPW